MRVRDDLAGALAGRTKSTLAGSGSGRLFLVSVADDRESCGGQAVAASIPRASREPVLSPVAQENVIARLSGKTVLVTSPPASPFESLVLHAVDRRVRLRWPETGAGLPAPPVGVEVSCALGDALYILQGEAMRLSGTDVMLRVASGMWRVQRRDNFRVSVPPRTGLVYRIRTSKAQSLTTEYMVPVLDLSARGAQLRWLGAIHAPDAGERFSGALYLQSRQILVFDATVRRVEPSADGLRVGIEFVGIPQAEQHRLSMLCFELERAQR